MKTYKKITKKLSKILILFLVVMFFVAPLAPILADTSDTTISTDTVSPVLDIAPVQDTPTVVPPLPISSDTIIDEDTHVEPVKDMPAVKAPSVKKGPLIGASAISSSVSTSPVPSAFGANSKAILPQIDSNTGALAYSYPIALPQGRNGMTPDVSMQYNSQKNDNTSIVGYGWNLSIPYIVRKNTHGTDQLYQRNDYTSSQDGDLVLSKTSGNLLTFIPESQTADFHQYILNITTNTWKLIDKNGTVVTFGQSSTSRQDDPNNSSRIYTWFISSVVDSNSNSITYSYSKDSGQIYPSTINYAGSNVDAGIFEVDFLKEARTDIITSNASAFSVTTNYRISKLQAKVLGVVKSEYSFSYSVGDNGKRSLLKSVTMIGYDTNGTATILPPTVFSYTAHQGDIFNQNISQQVPGLSGIGSTTKGIITGDINSDGYPDIVKAYEWVEGSYSADKKIYIYNPTTNSFSLSTAYAVPSGIMNFTDSSYTTYDGGTRLLDINGDGQNDLMRTPYAYGPAPDKEINVGNGWTQVPNTDPKYSVSYVSNPWYTLFSDDFNGDGLIDYLQDSNSYTKLPENQIRYATKTSLNNGNGFNYYVTSDHSSGSGNQAYSYTPAFTGDNQKLMFDINGDGLADIIEATSSLSCGVGVCHTNYIQKVYINNGSSWNLDASYILPPNFAYFINGFNGSSTAPVQIADFNNDGLQDILVMGTALYINQGKSFIESSLGFPIADPSYLLTMDLNADGAPDFFTLGNNYVTFNTVTTHTDLLSSIILPAGGKSDIAYKSSTQYKNASGNVLNSKFPFIIETVNTITTIDPVNNVSSIDVYSYADGYYYFDSANPFTRKFAGFGIITKTDSIGNTTKTYFHQGNTSNSVQGEYQDDYWKIGNVYRVEQYDNSGHLYNKTINTWISEDLGGGAKFVKLAQTIHQTYDGDTTHADTTESYLYDANGNVTQKTRYGQVAGNDDGTFIDIATDAFVTSYQYAGNSLGNQFAVSRQTTIDQSSNKVQESKYYYDGLSFGILDKGNLTKQEDWKSGTSYINNQKSYNSFGLVITSTDANGNTTTYAYDGYNLYPATIANAKSQVTQLSYDYSSGQVVQKIDTNARVFQYTYDGLGRLLQEKQPDVITLTTLVVKNSYTYIDVPNATSMQTSNYLDAAIIQNSYTYFDGLGRKIQEKTQAENGNFSTKDYAYNNLGQLQKESLSYFSNSGVKTSPISNTNLYILYGYDAMGRIANINNSVGTNTNLYNDWKLTAIDPNNNAKDFYKDAYGNLIQVVEHNTGTVYSTFYNYNYSGNVTKITDALQNVRNFTYDGLGRKLTAQDLHAPTDKTFGTWTYAYDDASNLIKTTDPKNQTVNYTYDVLNRPLTEDFTLQPGIEVINAYDTGVEGIGRLAKTTSASVIQTTTYNALGLVKADSKLIDGKNFTTAYDYNRQGNQILIINPDGSQIKNIYSNAGLLDKTQRKESTDANFVDVVSNFDYSPTGQITVQNNANGVIATSTYNSAKMYRLTNKVTVNSIGLKLQDLAYSYDSVGNIMQAVDNSATDSKKISTYSYDNLYRLNSASITNSAKGQSNYIQNYTYDALGNILTKTETIGNNTPVISTYHYDGNISTSYANPDAVSSISNDSLTTKYIYDNNGNIALSGTGLYGFDYQNRLIKSATPSAQTPPSTTVEAYPSTTDGSVSYSGYTTWFAARAMTSGSVVTDNSAFFNVGVGKTSSSSNLTLKPIPSSLPLLIPASDVPANYSIERGFLLFDTSALPANAVITSAKLKVYVASKIDNTNDGKDFISVVQSSQPTASPLTVSSYPKVVIAEGIDVSERKDITDINSDKYLEFNLNAMGRDWISNIAVTKLALREGHDLLNIPFGGASGQSNQVKIRSSRYPGTDTDPVLEITYRMPVSATTVVSYSYDASGQRIKVINGPSTYYPTNFYNTDGINIAKHIFANGQDLATIQGTGSTSKIYYNATDSIGSSSVLTDSTGAVAETLDYFPFGSIRFDKSVTPAGATPSPLVFNEQRKYIGQEYDQTTGLNYLNARYYNATLARFISQDPLALNNPEKMISDPQTLNSYSYGNNNPITLSDPSGKNADVAQALLGTGLGFEGIGTALDTTILGAPAGLVIGGLGFGILGIGAGIYYFDKVHNTQPKGQVGGASKTTSSAPNFEFNNQNGKKQENSNNRSQKDSVKNEKGQEVFRGGNNFEKGATFNKNGTVKYGYSLNTDPANTNIVGKGGPHTLDNLPDGLKIVQQGNDLGHHQIIPTDQNLSHVDYQKLIDKIQLSPKK